MVCRLLFAGASVNTAHEASATTEAIGSCWLDNSLTREV